MIEIGRLCLKTAGRDAGMKCVIVDILDDKFVLIDGQTRRRKCNILHLEPLKEVIKIKKNVRAAKGAKARKEKIKGYFQKEKGRAQERDKRRELGRESWISRRKKR